MENNLVDVVIIPGNCLGGSASTTLEIQHYLDRTQTKCLIIWGDLAYSGSRSSHREIAEMLDQVRSRGTDILVLSNNMKDHQANGAESFRKLLCVPQMIIQLENVNCLVYAPSADDKLYCQDDTPRVDKQPGNKLSYFSKFLRQTFLSRSNLSVNDMRIDKLSQQAAIAIEHQCKFLITEAESSAMKAELKIAKGKVILIRLNREDRDTCLELVDSKWNFVSLKKLNEKSLINSVSYV